MPILENQRHELFAQAIAKGKTQLEAQMYAGMMPDRGNASRLTANDNIKKRVAELQQNATKRTEITVARVLQELAKIAFTDFSEYGEWNGKYFIVKDSKTLPPELTACVSEVKQTKDGIAFKLYDKLAALEKIGKHFAMFTENVAHTSPDGSMSPQEIDPTVVNALIKKLTE